MRKIKVLFLVVLFLIIAGIVFLIGKGKKEDQTYEEIRSEAIIETEDDESNEETNEYDETEVTKEEEETISYTSEIKVDYNSMIQKNPDYVCWLYIPGTDISLPVVMADDNEFYLHRTFDDKTYAYKGTLFIDAYSEKGIDQDNVIIYGHNMKDGSMFGTLKKFKDKAYFDEHPYIELHDKDGVRAYEIFSVRDVSSDIDTLNFALSDFDHVKYIQNAMQQSVNSRQIGITDKQIVTLSTCVGDYSRRLLISGIRVN